MSEDVHKVTLQVRAPRGTFPGEIAEGWYCVVDGHVVICDQNGKPLGPKRHLEPGADARLIACRMVRERRRSSVTGFNDRIHYPPLRY
jgi:hypothetical protein